MKRLSDRIRLWRLEIEQALNEERPLPTGVTLEAERVTLTLQLPQKEEDFSPGNPVGPNSEKSLSLEQVSIEFHVRKSQSPGESHSNQAEPVSSPRAPEELRVYLLEVATSAFGPGGFDNSARAEVFAELVAGMPQADLLAALKAVAQGTKEAHPPNLVYPITRLRQVLSFSPKGCEAAAQHLFHALEQTALSDFLEVISKDWVFGTHWS